MSEEIVIEDEVFEDDENVYENTGDESSDGTIDWEARAKKAEALIIKNKQKPKQTITIKSDSETEEVPVWGQKIIQSEQKREFGHDNKLSPETVDAVFRANGGKMPTETQLEEDELLKTVIQSYRAKERVSKNTPAGGRPPVYKGKTFADVVTSKDSTPTDKQDAFDAARKSITKR